MILILMPGGGEFPSWRRTCRPAESALTRLSTKLSARGILRARVRTRVSCESMRTWIACERWRCGMKVLRFVSCCGVTMALLSFASAQISPTNQPPTLPLTPDGHPDLTGTWLDNSATPLERPDALEGRQSLSDSEVLELKKRADRLFKSDKGDFAGGDAVFLAALANPD